MIAAQIVSIVYTPDTPDYIRPADHFARTIARSAELIIGKGIAGDRKGRFPARQINLMATETVAQLAREGHKTAPGELGEQIVICGIDVDRLAPGDRLAVGAGAVLEVDKLRTGCDRFERIQGIAKSQSRGRLGQMMRVVAGGTIVVGDPVTRLPASMVIA